MLPDERAFQNALDDNPADFGLRLVFADWLDEHGLEAEATAQRWMARNEIPPTPWCAGSPVWTFGVGPTMRLLMAGKCPPLSAIAIVHGTREMAEKWLVTVLRTEAS